MDKRQQIRMSRESREAWKWFARDQAYHKARFPVMSQQDANDMLKFAREYSVRHPIRQSGSKNSTPTDLTQPKQEVKEELKDQLKQEVKAELKDQLKQEVKQELEDEELMGATGN